MTACDTNILFPALERSHPDHEAARAYLTGQIGNESFAICELNLMEVYVLLRNPVTSAKPLSAAEAVRKIQNLRSNPRWAILDYPGELMDKVWEHAGKSAAFRRIFDVRLALTLEHHGVKRFDTVNVKDFGGYGFEARNPLRAGD